MFSWNIAKSAEAMFSRWAIKHVCKFILKKKLGEFIIGDIDLDQLNVQLRDGTIQLRDLALNVDYLNQKLGAASVVIKEGSIGSLLVKIPWKVKNCQIEVEELELVLCPCQRDNSPEGGNDKCKSQEDHSPTVNNGLGNLESGGFSRGGGSVPLDVHEGVKTIAKMVKWLLTSFHIQIKNTIVAFDPSSEKGNKIPELQKILVLRIAETEYGTCVFEDGNAGMTSELSVESFLGMTKLTNFVKFRGATVELLQMANSGTGASTPILTGEIDGFSGTVKLSMPWKGGSLDTKKVDADVLIDPVELRLQPSTIICLLCLWKFLNNASIDRNNTIHHKAADSVSSSSSSCYYSFSVAPSIAMDKVVPNSVNFSPDLSTLTSQEATTDALLSGTHLIPNWVPLSGNQKDEVEGEPDYSASISQFFECFDGMRSSQAALGTSGIWNWTYSVFSAITAASTLASGSVNISSEKQHVETNVKATIVGVSVSLSFLDETEDVHYMKAKCRDLALALQISPKKMKFDVMIKHVEVGDFYNEGDKSADYGNEGDKSADYGFLGHNNSSARQKLSVKHLQTEVQGALPPFHFATQDSESEILSGSHKSEVIKVPLIRSLTDSGCHFSISYPYSDSKSTPTTFSLILPPFIFWVNFGVVNMLSDMFKKVVNSIEKDNMSSSFGSGISVEKDGSPCLGHIGSSSNDVTSFSSKGSMQGSISLSHARVIVCFPYENEGDFRLCSDFIGLDFSPSFGLKGATDSHSRSSVSSQKGFSCNSFSSIQLQFGDLQTYLITSAAEGGKTLMLSGKKIISVTRKDGHNSCIGMFWQEGLVTGPWIARKAWCMATSRDSSRNKAKGSGYEFASVTTMKDLEDTNSSVRQEIILSSAFVLHIQFPCVWIGLNSFEYKKLHHLLNQVMNGLTHASNIILDDDLQKKGASPSHINLSQASVHVECDVVKFSIDLDQGENIKSSIKKELPGLWAHLHLTIEKFELLSVSNIGGISSASFFWVSHNEGELRGSISEASDSKQDFLLISCSNSAIGRGDGEGTNALSSGYSGTIIVHIWNPQLVQNFSSITVRCATIVAPGCRLDWMNDIFSFFNLPSSDAGEVDPDDVQKLFSEDSFFLHFVDIALSYEPHVRNLTVGDVILESEPDSEQFVACLLASASLSLSNQTTANSDYKIRLQDVGFLLSPSSTLKPGPTYGIHNLRSGGYVKVAGEALVEATLKTNSTSGLLWEFECSDSHVTLNTCHDTTAGLIHLIAQIQDLFAPDIEESIVHLQTRWNTIQETHDDHEDPANPTKIFNNSSSILPASRLPSSGRDATVVGLMDEILDDAFYLNGDQTLCDSFKARSLLSRDECGFQDVCNPLLVTSRSDGFFSPMPELIEGYYISTIPLESPCADNILLNLGSNCKPKKAAQVSAEGGESGGWYGDCSFSIVDDHISNSSDHSQTNEESKFCSISCDLPSECCKPRGRVVLRNIDVRWRMYAGSDWGHLRKNCLLTPNKGGRDETVCLELTLSGMNINYDMFPDGGLYASKLSLSVQDFHLHDRSRDAPWKMVLGYYHSKDHPRESCAKAFRLDLEAVRPDPLTPLEEYRLSLMFLPIRLRLDQGQLDFLTSFFAAKDLSIDQSLIQTELDEPRISQKKSCNVGGQTVVEEALLPFFQKFDICPVVVRVDYNPRHIDLAALGGGNYAELLNLVPWKGIELQLKHVHAVGVYGWSSICETIFGEWLEDISQNQVHKLLKGLAPIRSLFSVGSGAAKLISLPVQSYRKDNRLLKGMQRGAIAFIRSISLEAVGLGLHLAAGSHNILLQTEYILSGVPSSTRSRAKRNVGSNQPNDAQQGIQQAYESLSDGLGKTASALLGNPIKSYQRGAGAGPALASAVRAAPAAAIAPASAAARAMHCALLGVRNSLDPELKKESLEKYSGTVQSRDL